MSEAKIPDDLKKLYEHYSSEYFVAQAIYLAELPREDLLKMIERIAALQQQVAALRKNHPFGAMYDALQKAQAENADLRAQLARMTQPVKRWWFAEARPIINAIGEISVQEAMDAIERARCLR
jgi:hypothetical protein